MERHYALTIFTLYPGTMMTIIGSLVLFLFLLYFPLSYFGFLLDSLTRTAYRGIIIGYQSLSGSKCVVTCYRRQ